MLPAAIRRATNAVKLVGLAATLGACPLAAQDAAVRIPLVAGLALGSTLHSAAGEREDLLEILSADTGGVHYAWHERTITRERDTTTGYRKRFVRASDLAGAPRLDDLFGHEEVKRPGFTAASVSAAVYRQLRDAGSAPYSIILTPPPAGGADEHAALAALLAPARVRYKGTLARVSPASEPFPLIVNGRRVSVPSLRLRGSFTDGRRKAEWDAWVLADSTHPLLLKSVLDDAVFQMVRADLPAAGGSGRAGGPLEGKLLEQELGASCRLELPGVYFAFGTAAIDPISDRALAEVARVLARHRDWRFTVEGHTDSVGTVAANQALSQRRAEAVLARLGTQHDVDTSGWGAAGYGASRPREPNATIEGRARNRRVELVRDCR
jgi:outer membrane protein OmpA-like peptidoglycan-associated protein